VRTAKTCAVDLGLATAVNSPARGGFTGRLGYSNPAVPLAPAAIVVVFEQH
jgi:hypothetical protein